MLRKAKIMCTIGKIPETNLKNTVKQFIDAGMDVARINMAHYDLTKDTDRKYLKDLIATIRKISEASGKTVAILGDIQGPKVRIKEFLGKCQGEKRCSLQVGEEFVLTSQSHIASDKLGASIIYEGAFKFFRDIQTTVKRDNQGNPKPIEFWFGDGKVILEASKDNITSTSATCRTKVAGELKKNQGVSVKNATIKPEQYSLAVYPKDGEDIGFLLQNDIDLLALSFVNCKEDVGNLQQYIKLRIREKGLLSIEKRFRGMKEFPVISKIETEEGVRRLDEILEVSYGIMVARGDLALRTGIQTIGILQKQIIDKCVTEGKPVITATQMLLSMMDFIEPKRPEATDVTNAIFDGSNTLMLSEETADPGSKYPLESIQMMAEIIMVTEKRINDLNVLEYKYKIDQRHEKDLVNLSMKKSKLEEDREEGIFADNEYRERKAELQRVENTSHISYDVCKTAFELKCKAIIVLTDTGGTARMVSRFKPDIPILAGVYEDLIARLLKLSYGVETFRITRKDSGYPFEEFQEVIEQAKQAKLVENGDRVILVAGYPRREPGTVTFLNVYHVEGK